MTRYVYSISYCISCKYWTQLNLMILYDTIDTISYDTVLYHIVHIYIYTLIYCILYHLSYCTKSYHTSCCVSYHIIPQEQTRLYFAKSYCPTYIHYIHIYIYIIIYIYRGSPYTSPTALRSGTVILVCFRGLYSAWRMEKATWIPWNWS